MILVDTPIWIDHLHKSEPRLVALLQDGKAFIHPYVVTELALGNLTRRSLRAFSKLPECRVGAHWSVMEFLDRRDLHGSGVGFVDVHQLLSTHLTDGLTLWTRDRRLRTVAEELGVAAVGLA